MAAGDGLSVNGCGSNDGDADRTRDCLMPEADPEQRAAFGDAGGGEDNRNPGRVGVAGAGREEKAVDRTVERGGEREAVALDHLDRCSEDKQIVDQREGKAVVIVDDQEGGHGSREVMAAARSPERL